MAGVHSALGPQAASVEALQELLRGVFLFLSLIPVGGVLLKTNRWGRWDPEQGLYIFI